MSKLIDSFLKFVNQSPSPFHCVASSIALLESSGFSRINEIEANSFSNLALGAKYYVTRNQSSIIAFAVGGKWKQGNGTTIAAAHTDSPVLKVKPKSRIDKGGFVQVGVECYGGGLWYTWFDRDLGLAGRVIVQNGDMFESRLVRIDKPVLKIPSLAIHLNRSVNDEGFKVNKETHTIPILATVEKALSSGGKHSPLLLKLIAEELNVDAVHIRDFEMFLYDTQSSCLGGALNEFIFSARLDNQLMSYISLQSLIGSIEEGNLADDTNIRMVALFDHEECGSQSQQGAASNFLHTILTRLNGSTELAAVSIANSFLVSADMAHAVHPNYPAAHEDNHRPMIHKGLVLKENSNQRYASNLISMFILSEIAKKHGIPVQDFVVRNDVMCGSTVGPILAANTGLRTVDVGVPQFSMHSIRETCGVEDVISSYNLIKHYFEEFSLLNKKILVDK